MHCDLCACDLCACDLCACNLCPCDLCLYDFSNCDLTTTTCIVAIWVLWFEGCDLSKLLHCDLALILHCGLTEDFAVWLKLTFYVKTSNGNNFLTVTPFSAKYLSKWPEQPEYCEVSPQSREKNFSRPKSPPEWSNWGFKFSDLNFTITTCINQTKSPLNKNIT